MTRSEWTHAICTLCWAESEPGRAPQSTDGPVETCCRCGVWTTSGIYLRGDPDDFIFCAH